MYLDDDEDPDSIIPITNNKFNSDTIPMILISQKNGHLISEFLDSSTVLLAIDFDVVDSVDLTSSLLRWTFQILSSYSIRLVEVATLFSRILSVTISI